MLPAFVIIVLVLGSFAPWPWKVLAGMTGAAHAPLHIACFAAAAFVISERFSHTVYTRIWLGLVALGVAIELIQWMLFRNDFEWADVLYDAAGVGITCAARSLRPVPSCKPQAQ